MYVDPWFDQPYEFKVGAPPGKERKRDFVDNPNGLFSAQAAPKPPPAMYSITEGMKVGGKVSAFFYSKLAQAHAWFVCNLLLPHSILSSLTFYFCEDFFDFIFLLCAANGDCSPWGWIWSKGNEWNPSKSLNFSCRYYRNLECDIFPLHKVSPSFAFLLCLTFWPISYFWNLVTFTCECMKTRV